MTHEEIASHMKKLRERAAKMAKEGTIRAATKIN